MNEQLLYDSRTKQTIKDSVYLFLYGHKLKKLSDQIKYLINKNATLLGKHSNAFSYKGITYTNGVGTLPRKLDRLNPLLHEMMGDYIKDVKHLNQKELPYVLGFISQVLNSSNSLQDYLMILPECTHEPINKLIATCPCRTKALELTPEQIAVIDSNQLAISLIKQRLMLNLIT